VAVALVALRRTDDGGWWIDEVPSQVPSDDVTVLYYAGVGLFAEVARIDEEWPSVAGTRNAVVVLNLRALPDVPSSVAIKALRRWAGELKSHNGRLIITGVTPVTPVTPVAARVSIAAGWPTCSVPTASCPPPTGSSARWTWPSHRRANGFLAPVIQSRPASRRGRRRRPAPRR
jgi:hypothetical protein